MPEGTTKDGIGAALRRKEDKKFLTGSGRYTADISRPGQLHVHFIRSDHAHAKITSIKTDAAAKADGVVAIYTGEDVAADGIGGPICGWVVTNRDGSPTNEPPHVLDYRHECEYEVLALVVDARTEMAALGVGCDDLLVSIDGDDTRVMDQQQVVRALQAASRLGFERPNMLLEGVRDTEALSGGEGRGGGAVPAGAGA